MYPMKGCTKKRYVGRNERFEELKMIPLEKWSERRQVFGLIDLIEASQD